MMPAPASDAELLALFERLALAAGRRIMDVDRAGAKVERKADLSPVTEADRAAETIILSGLRAAFPALPCVAEEELSAGFLPGDLGEEFFLIDPLDGTKEFINRRPDFTVNIALIRDGVPVVGVVHAPADGRLYAGRPGFAEMVSTDGQRRRITVRSAPARLNVVASRSHTNAETDAFLAGLEADIVSIGSSLKFCLLAAGEADLYPRFGRTMEWDTAAGDAVLRAAGGMTSTLDGRPLAYGKRNQAADTDFANPFFIATSSPEGWQPS